MARNMVQFQKGFSEPEFERLYGSEEACRAALFKWRWPNGFVCPGCGGTEYCIVKQRGLYQCNACRRQTSLIAGTIFAATKLPLTIWFRAMYHVTQTKQGISSLELGRRLGVTQTTAWKIKHKLAQVMMERDDEKQLDGRVEMDDFYLGGERSGGKRGRGSPGKKPCVIGVETTDDGKPVRIKLKRVTGFTKAAIKALAERHLTTGARVVSDGLNGFRGIADAGRNHEPSIAAQLGHSEKLPQFKWANTVLANIKNAIIGTCRGARKHAARTLAEFEYRFNRRYDLTAMIPRLAYVATRTPPMPYRLLKLAEDDA
ncbi:MAG: IS1595 family transposase [Hyphomicrobiaceae bacterium]|nr:IS1595 family transposase [Hyphomicrobiaceae bacterium]MCK5495893.1 IS1595 family transposase [Hyphomicrobiaceae bacterium]MCK5551306.1 IS1595 family transposase [Hyphomicrobiaceae bacterium]